MHKSWSKKISNRAILLLCVPAICLATVAGGAQTAPTPDSQASSISLSPALISVNARPGQAFTQELTLWNNTDVKLAFELEARDVVVHDGKRNSVPSGETKGSIARYAVFDEKDVTVLPRSYFHENVTVTIPNEPGPRAIVILFVGKTLLATRGSLAMIGSLGALVTFTINDDFHVETEPVEVTVDNDARIVTFHQSLRNTGLDPVIPKGVIAVTNENGVLVARLPVSGQRLLPGETVDVTAEHVGLFRTGRYKAMSLMENGNKFFSNEASFTIK